MLSLVMAAIIGSVTGADPLKFFEETTNLWDCWKAGQRG